MTREKEVVKTYKAINNGNESDVRIVKTNNGYTIEVVDDITTADWGKTGATPVYRWTYSTWYGVKEFKTVKGAENRIRKMLSFSKEWELKEVA